MSNIYQKIWDADQTESGIQAILDTQNGNPSRGFVKVNSQLNDTDKGLQVLPEILIPDSKQHTYNLCRVLFDNYALREKDVETETPEEREEVHDLVHTMADTAPMHIAREYVAQATNTSITRERWYNTLMEMWFRPFSMGGDPHLTGFEHVVVGEQEGAKAQGYHFWYKYYLDDGFAREVDGMRKQFPGLTDDRIVYLGSKQSSGQAQFPESVTISYRWNAADYERKKLRPLTKKIGGFFVGCSIEGLLALGTVRAHIGARAPKEAEINGAKYNLKLFRSSNNLHIRTFYPVFLSATEGNNDKDETDNNNDDIAITSQIRIIAALINPEGHDPGKETVTLINTGSTTAALHGWRLLDRNNKSLSLSGVTIEAGEAIRLILNPSAIQLSNKGGKITLIDTDQNIVHTVTYSKGQVREDGRTVLF